jgi:hypothetical protein
MPNVVYKIPDVNNKYRTGDLQPADGIGPDALRAALVLAANRFGLEHLDAQTT